MAEVVAGGDEGFESLLKRVYKMVQQTGILSELRRREHYEKPSVKRKQKRAARGRSMVRTMRK